VPIFSLANKLLSELDNQLQSLELEYDIILKRSELSFYTTKKVIEGLKVMILKHKFRSENEEIRFFKEVKPLFTSRLVYHLMVYNLETRKPSGGKEILKKYYVKQLESLKHYFDYNIDFYKYYRAGATYLDDKYFVRNKLDLQLTPDGHIFENDPRFSTTHDFKVAKILAHDRLQVYIEKKLTWLDNREPGYQFSKEEPRFKLVWTESKASLIELIYAFYVTGSFNKGSLELKELAVSLSEYFNIELGDIYRSWAEIKLRKDPTKFLDTLKTNLEKKIKEDLK